MSYLKEDYTLTIEIPVGTIIIPAQPYGIISVSNVQNNWLKMHGFCMNRTAWKKKQKAKTGGKTNGKQ